MRKRIKLKEGIYLNQIDTNKFKSNMLVFYIVRPLNKKDVTMNALLPLVLRRGTRNYKNNLEIQKKLEELYGAKLGISILVKGNKHVIRISIRFINDKFIKDNNFVKEILKLINELIFHPYLEEGKFKEEYVEQEKINLKRRIEREINDKRGYAIEKTINIMCRNEKFSIPNLGYIDEIDNINSKKLYDYYKTVIKESPIEIFHIGNNDNKIEEYFINKEYERTKNILNYDRETIITKVENIKYSEENMDVNQGKLVLGYRTAIPYEDELYSALVVANTIFGAGSNSKLFLNVREKESLAYYIVSRIYKYKSILIVDAGIDFNKYEKTLSIINNELDNMKKGNITNKEIEIAKSIIVSSLKSSKDSLGGISELEFDNILTNDERLLEEKIEDIKKVEIKDIINASKTIKLDTVYFMKNDKMMGDNI